MSNDKLIHKFKDFWNGHATSISTIGGLLAIAAAFFSVTSYVDSEIEEQVKSKTKIHTELLSALFVQQSDSPYNAARRYREIYENEKTKRYKQDLREALVTGLLSSIAESGFPEEFENTVEQIREDKFVSLQRYELNQIGSIYIQLGYTEQKAPEILEKAISRLERGNSEPKTSKALSHWLLTLVYLANADVDKAVTQFKKANRIKSDNFRIEDLTFKNIEEAKLYITDFGIMERINMKRENLPELLLDFSEKLNR